ncbi:hypothetical protein MPLB_1410008 [Mesorhizobium sp. ORS 3324]|nr:hypothetical protein MPLB_1410008 [Mesorhizobium sp. ORS 3324]
MEPSPVQPRYGVWAKVSQDALISVNAEYSNACRPKVRSGLGNGERRNKDLSAEANLKYRDALLGQFQEKRETVFRQELRQNKEIEWFAVSVKR